MSYPASYKKEPGLIEIIDDSKVFIWKPTNVGSTKPIIKIELSTVAQLQATPPKSEKLQLKIVCTDGEATSTGASNTPTGTPTPSPAVAGSQSYQFAFKDRSIMENAKSILQKLVQSIRSDNSKKSQDSKPQSKQAVVDLDSKRLLLNLNLQQALLKENKELMRTFQETVINGGLANDKFWNTRINLLRAYALTSSQKRGAYNVLGTIRPTTGSDNQINVSLTREKIHDIFEQYPIVRQAYSDNVPVKMGEGQFWERFFLSRLFRRLRGEKVPTSHIVDSILDTKYLTLYEDELEEYTDRMLGNKRKRNEEDKPDMYHKLVPQYLDIGGNEENDPQKLGNLPDITMQPGKDATAISLIRSMNSLSQKMLYGNSSPHIISGNKDADKDEGIALEEQLEFDDLKVDSINDSNLELNLRQDNNNATSTNNILDMPVEKVKESFSTSLSGELYLNSVHPDIKLAANQIFSIIKLRSKESDQGTRIWSDNDQDKRLLDQVQLCHATSIEFLRHFWLNFQSGDPNQASTISKLVISLTKSLERIEAVAKAAPTIEGQTNARHSLSALTVSIKTALEKYERALEETEKQA